ncbi:MAG: SWIM zinc finger family protein, partial [Actinomycetales bacterium]|nr:SWIM zinc finger family protein [Actinomycetales bacterium]
MTPTGFASTSVLTSTPGAPSSDPFLALATSLGATPAGPVDHPDFFDGFVAHPHVLAAGLLAVAEVAATAYYDIARARAPRDPVVTASGDRLRFEAMSACHGVYARLDLLSDGIESGQVAFGTTNVDINDPLRAGLAGMRRTELLHLAVGMESLRLATPDATHTERKVELPRRWVRSLAEVQVVGAGMRHAGTVPASAARTFLGALPTSGLGPSVGFLVTPRGLARVDPSAPGAVRLAGTARASALRRVARFISGLDVWAHESGGSAWVVTLPGARLTVVASPEPHRGFSGEGGLLETLATGEGSDDDAARVLEHLAWQSSIDPAAIAADAGLSVSAAHGAVGRLAAAGRVGFDLAESTHFHRELPYDADQVERDNPRLVAARELVASGGVVPEGGRWRVPGTDRTHWVSLDGGGSCTCAWWTRHG